MGWFGLEATRDHAMGLIGYEDLELNEGIIRYHEMKEEKW